MFVSFPLFWLLVNLFFVFFSLLLSLVFMFYCVSTFCHFCPSSPKQNCKKTNSFNLLCFHVYHLNILHHYWTQIWTPLVLPLGPSKLKAHFYLTIYLQQKSSFYILVAKCEISIMLLWLLHFLFIFVWCLCALLIISLYYEENLLTVTAILVFPIFHPCVTVAQHSNTTSK